MDCLNPQTPRKIIFYVLEELDMILFLKFGLASLLLSQHEP
jgi:hypothetical protein